MVKEVEGRPAASQNQPELAEASHVSSTAMYDRAAP